MLALVAVPYFLYGLYWSVTRFTGDNDLVIFINSGRAVIEGANPYSPDLGSPWLPNANPPVSLFLFQLFPNFPREPLGIAWYVLSFGIYLVCLAVLNRYYLVRNPTVLLAWALIQPGLWITLQEGQIYMPLLLAIVGAWILMNKGQHLAAGLLIGFVSAVKVNFLLWPVILVFTGFPLAGLTALAAAGLLTGVSIWAFGVQVFQQWLEGATSAAGFWDGPFNGSLWGIMARLHVQAATIVLGGCIILLIVFYAWRHKSSAVDVSGLALAASVILSPLAWQGYALFLLPIFFSRQWKPVLLAAAVLLAMPFQYLSSDFLSSHPLTLGSVYGYTLILVLAGLLVHKP